MSAVAIAPVNAFALWQPEALTVIRGAGNIGSYNKTPRSSRKWCKNCGGHLFTEHPEMALVDVYAALAPQLAYTPEVHAHYLEAVVHVKDGLAKLQDVPVEMGGSGLNMAE